MLNPDASFYRRLFDVCTKLMETIQFNPQPVIVQVHGMPTVANCQMVATCDLAVTSEEVRFATPGVKIGLLQGRGRFGREGDCWLGLQRMAILAKKRRIVDREKIMHDQAESVSKHPKKVCEYQGRLLNLGVVRKLRTLNDPRIPRLQPYGVSSSFPSFL
jgi:hypothetical protein